MLQWYYFHQEFLNFSDWRLESILQYSIYIQGWEFAHRFLERFAHFLWAKEKFAHEKEWIAPVALCHERPERIAHGCSFVKSDRSESLKSLFKKDHRERFALGHKKGEKLSKTYKKYEFFERIAHFLRAIHSKYSFLILILLDKPQLN